MGPEKQVILGIFGGVCVGAAGVAMLTGAFSSGQSNAPTGRMHAADDPRGGYAGGASMIPPRHDPSSFVTPAVSTATCEDPCDPCGLNSKAVVVLAADEGCETPSCAPEPCDPCGECAPAAACTPCAPVACESSTACL